MIRQTPRKAKLQPSLDVGHDLQLQRVVQTPLGRAFSDDRMLAAEWGRHYINVNCISPSYVLTPMPPPPDRRAPRIRELTAGPRAAPGRLYGRGLPGFRGVELRDRPRLMVDGGHTLNAWLTTWGVPAAASQS